MRECPFNGCGEVVSSDLFCCRRHWFLLSKDQQARMWAAWNRYNVGDLGIEQLREAQQAVIDEVQPRSLF